MRRLSPSSARASTHGPARRGNAPPRLLSARIWAAALGLAIAVLLLASSAPASPTTPILDNFNRANEDPLSDGSNWSTSGVDGGSPLRLFGNQVGNGDSGSSYRVASMSGSMEAYGTISVGLAALQAVTVFIALNDVGTSGWDGYGLRLINVFSPDEQYRIRKIVNGVETNIAGGGWDEPFSGGGERLLLRKVGDTLEAWKSAAGSGTWTLKASVTDSSYSSGRIGLRITDQSGGNASWDDFGGGAIGSAPPPAQSNGTFWNGPAFVDT